MFGFALALKRRWFATLGSEFFGVGGMGDGFLIHLVSSKQFATKGSEPFPTPKIHLVSSKLFATKGSEPYLLSKQFATKGSEP